MCTRLSCPYVRYLLIHFVFILDVPDVYSLCIYTNKSVEIFPLWSSFTIFKLVESDDKMNTE